MGPQQVSTVVSTVCQAKWFVLGPRFFVFLLPTRKKTHLIDLSTKLLYVPTVERSASESTGTFTEVLQKESPAAAKKPAPKLKKQPKHSKDGVFSPLVLFVKGVMGDEQLNKLRGTVISAHSNVLGSFVDTADTTVFGDVVLKALFRWADRDQNGSISHDELPTAFQSLGFVWLRDKQIAGIFARADADGNGTIGMEEWVREAPKTLRTNIGQEKMVLIWVCCRGHKNLQSLKKERQR